MAPLDRALALDERDDRAVLIAEQLNLDVPRTREPPLEIDRRVTERRSRFRPRRPDGGERGAILDGAHALSATARDGLDQQRIADRVRRPRDLIVARRVGERMFRPGDHGHAGANGGFARGSLAAHQRDRISRRADERQPRVGARTREGGVLGQEPVTGMHRVRAGALRGVDDGVDAQVALDRFARTDVERLVRLAHVARVAVAVGKHCHGRQPHFAAGADNPDGDLAAIRYQDFHQSVRQGRPPYAQRLGHLTQL